jgi:8-oxo-dGTP pyrophosphatase MutT (NUDIX family)
MVPRAKSQTAGALLFDGARRVLLGLRAAHKSVAPNCWDIIGGRVEPDETVEEALVREVGEELGVTPTRFARLGSFVEAGEDGSAKAVHHVFAVIAWSGGAPRNMSDEHVEIRWFATGEVAQLMNKTPFDFPALFALAEQLWEGGGA